MGVMHMNCPQCNTSLPDSATFCYKCGASTRQTTFSYLPAGTPAWPHTVPQNLFYKPDLAKTIVQEGQSIVGGARSPARSRRSTRGILLFVAFCVLTCLVGVLATLGWEFANGAFATGAASTSVHIPARAVPSAGSTNAPSPTAAAQTNQLPTPTSFQKANSREVGITLNYPSNWIADAPQSTTSGNVSVSFHPQQQLPVGLSVGRFSATNSSQVPGTDVINQATLQSFGSNATLTNMQTLTNTPRHPSIGSANWDELDATFNTSSGELVHAVSISVKHNSIYFNIFYFSLATVYNEAVQKYYSQMLSSFKFLA
jgi:hypothetical protein